MIWLITPSKVLEKRKRLVRYILYRSTLCSYTDIRRLSWHRCVWLWWSVPTPSSESRCWASGKEWRISAEPWISPGAGRPSRPGTRKCWTSSAAWWSRWTRWQCPGFWENKSFTGLFVLHVATERYCACVLLCFSNEGKLPKKAKWTILSNSIIHFCLLTTTQQLK